MSQLFDINIYTSLDYQLPDETSGTLYIIADESDVRGKIPISDTLLSGLKGAYSFIDSRIRFLRPSLYPDFDFNVVCTVEDPLSGTRLYITATAKTDLLDIALYSVLNEAESQMRKFVEEGLLMTAFKDPQGYKRAVREVFSTHSGFFHSLRLKLNNLWQLKDDEFDDELDDEPDSESDSRPSVKPDSLPEVEPDNEPDNKPWLDIPEFYSESDEFDGGDYCSDAIAPAPDSSLASRFEKKVFSAKDKIRVFDSLTERVPASFMKDGTEEDIVVNDTFMNMSMEEQLAILCEYAKKHRGVFKEFHEISIRGGFKYRLILRPWELKYDKQFKSKYRYCLYLVDRRGRERPVLFKHNPSFCIYVMYMVDRYNRRDDVTDLSIKSMEKEFKSIYKFIIDEEDSRINELFNNMVSRESKNGRLREGRYGEYIKDIHSTFESLMDNVNSIPFKVGFGRYLQVPPENLGLPDKLTKLKIV